MKKILLVSALVPLIACVNYKDTYTKNANSTGAYVANSVSNTISQYSVDSTTYKLTELGTVAAGTTPVNISIHPNSKFVYAVNSGSNTISVYSISTSTRKLTLASTTSVTGTTPVYIGFNSAGTYAYVMNAGDNSITSFFVTTTTGGLSNPGNIALSCTPVDFAVVGSLMFVACNATSQLLTYTMDSSTGALTAASTYALGASTATYVAPHPSGTYIFGTQTDGSVGSLTFDPAGTMTGSSSLSSGSNAVGVYFNASGSIAWVINKTAGTINSYTVTSGALSTTALATSTVGTSPTAMTFAGSYAYAYVVNSGDNTVGLYTVNSTTGALTLSSTIATGTTPTNLVGY